MKVSLRNGSKLYICDSCYAEVYSLICRRIDGEDYDICENCYEEEVKVEAIHNADIILNWEEEVKE